MQFQVVGTDIILDSPEECVKYAEKCKANVQDSLSEKVVTYNIFTKKLTSWSSQITFDHIIKFKDTLTQEERELFYELLSEDSEDEDYVFSNDYSLREGSILLFLSREDENGQASGYFEVSSAIIHALREYF